MFIVLESPEHPHSFRSAMFASIPPFPVRIGRTRAMSTRALSVKHFLSLE